MNETNRLLLRMFCKSIRTTLGSVESYRIQNGICVVVGMVPIAENKSVKCVISFGAGSPYLLRPKVVCYAPWLKEGNDWHRNNDPQKSLCYVLPEHWRRVMKVLRTRLGPTPMFCEIAAKWMIDSVEWLLEAHWYAYKYDIEKWPIEWPQWPHSRDDAKRLCDALSPSDVVTFVAKKGEGKYS
jgi:hypothetical protein